jgi:hypothetical protein
MAQMVVRDVNREYGEEPNWIILPYVFRSETFDTSVGVFGVISKYPLELVGSLSIVNHGVMEYWSIGFSTTMVSCFLQYSNTPVLHLE